jgi:flagellar protein FlaF
MGFSTVIGTGISIIMLLAAGYVIIAGFTGAVDSMSISMKESQDLLNDQLKTEIKVENFNRINDNMFQLTVNNTGNIKITNVSRMDMILKFSDPSNTTFYLPYRSEITGSENAWSKASISPDNINPGIFDPGEKMEVRVYITTGLPNNAGWVRAITPNGVSGSSYFVI